MTDPYTPESPFIPTLPPDAANGQTFDEYRWSQLTEDNKRLTESIGIQQRILELLKVRTDEILSRLDMLEDAGKPPAKPKDELNERIVEFLKSHPDLKFTAISIDENLDATGKDLSDRCKNLARNGRIRMFAEANRRPFYQALPPTPPEA